MNPTCDGCGAEGQVCCDDHLPLGWSPGRCGCQHGNTILPDGRRAYVIEPCRNDYQFYVFAQEEAARQSKPIQFRGV